MKETKIRALIEDVREGALPRRASSSGWWASA